MNSPSSCAKYARVIRVQSREKLTPLPSAKIGRPTFSPNISRVPLSAQFAAAFISNFHGELKFQFNHLGSVLIRPLKFQMRSVPGTQRPRDKAGMLRPPFATAVPLPPPTPDRTSTLLPPTTTLTRCAFTILSPDRSGTASNHAQIFIQRFPSKPRGKIS